MVMGWHESAAAALYPFPETAFCGLEIMLAMQISMSAETASAATFPMDGSAIPDSMVQQWSAAARSLWLFQDTTSTWKPLEPVNLSCVETARTPLRKMELSLSQVPGRRMLKS